MQALTEHVHRNCVRPPPPDEPYPRVHAEWPEEDTRSWGTILATAIDTVRPPKTAAINDNDRESAA